MQNLGFSLAGRMLQQGCIRRLIKGHLEKPRRTRFFEVPLDHRLGEGVINQRVTMYTMGIPSTKPPSLIGFARCPKQ